MLFMFINILLQRGSTLLSEHIKPRNKADMTTETCFNIHMHHTQWFLNCGLAWLSMKKNMQDSKQCWRQWYQRKTIHRLITQFNITWFSQISSGKLRWWKSSRAHYSRRRASSSSGARFLTNVSKKGIRPTISVKNTRELLALSFCFKCSCFANFSPNPLKRTAEAKSGTQAILSQHSLRQFICKCLGQNQYTLHIANTFAKASLISLLAHSSIAMVPFFCNQFGREIISS